PSAPGPFENSRSSRNDVERFKRLGPDVGFPDDADGLDRKCCVGFERRAHEADLVVEFVQDMEQAVALGTVARVLVEDAAPLLRLAAQLRLRLRVKRNSANRATATVPDLQPCAIVFNFLAEICMSVVIYLFDVRDASAERSFQSELLDGGDDLCDVVDT